jgi:hypothetical protein
MHISGGSHASGFWLSLDTASISSAERSICSSDNSIGFFDSFDVTEMTVITRVLAFLSYLSLHAEFNTRLLRSGSLANRLLSVLGAIWVAMMFRAAALCTLITDLMGLYIESLNLMRIQPVFK